MALGPGPAGAQNGETVVTSRVDPRGGYVLDATAAAGQENNLHILHDPADPTTKVVVEDTGPGITEDSPRCNQVDATTVECKLQGLRSSTILAGDRDDRVVVLLPERDLTNTFWAEAGSDRIELPGGDVAIGGAGNDRLMVRKGNQRLYGGRSSDTITGGRDNKDYCDGQADDDSGGAGCETKVSL